MKNLRFLFLFFSAFQLTAKTGYAQCTPPIPDVCTSKVSITGLPTTAISNCVGTPLIFNSVINWPAPLTEESHSWSLIAPVSESIVPGAPNTTNLSTTFNAPTTPTVYCLKATALGPELIFNGDFELGYMCCTPVTAPGYVLFAGAVPSPTYMPAGNYIIGTTTAVFGAAPIRCPFPDNTTGTGNMLIVNGPGAPLVGVIPDIWEQNVPVCPQQKYRFTMFCKNWTNVTSAAQTPQMQVLINNIVVNTTVLTLGCAGPWQQITFTWVNGTGVTANIRIRDATIDAVYNDYVLDDISFRRISEDTKCVSVNPLPSPEFSVPPVDVCSGDLINVCSTPTSPSVGTPWSYSWSWGPTTFPCATHAPVFTTSGISVSETLTITNAYGCSSTEPVSINVYPLPDAGTLHTFLMPNIICSGDVVSVFQFGGSSGGTWSSSDPVNAPVSSSGVVSFGTFLVPTTVIISYTVSSPLCGTDVATIALTVKPRPVFTVAPVDVCSGDLINVCSTPAIPPVGAPWIYSWSWGPTTSPCATHAPVITTSGISLSQTLTITNAYGCSATEPVIINVNPLPDAGTLHTFLMPNIICSGDVVSVFRFGGSPFGTWSSSDPINAPVSSSGVVSFGTFLVPTTVIISYTVSSPPCGTDVATIALTVKPRPVFTVAPVNVCSGDIINVCSTPAVPPVGAPWTYFWSSGAATSPCAVYPTVITPSAITIPANLTITNVYGCSATVPFTIDVMPTPAPTIIQPVKPELCVGQTTLVYGNPGIPGAPGISYNEAWTSSNPGVASVASFSPGVGLITGISAGTAIITYSVTSTAGPTFCSGFTTFMITILPTPNPITGPTTVCEGYSIVLSSTTPGGYWESDNTSIATVAPDAMGNGVVTGVSGGVVVIRYYFGPYDRACPATYIVTVMPMPTDICPTWHYDLVWGMIVFDIGGVPGAGTVTYDCFNPGGTLLGSGTCPTGSTLSSYPVGTTRLCVTSVTIGSCTWYLYCCAFFNEGSPKQTGNANLGAANKNVESISIVPNPNNGTFSLTGQLPCSDACTVEIEVTDVLGKTIYSEKTTVDKGTLNTKINLGSEIANGVYLVRVKNNDMSEVIRFTLDR